MSEVMSSENTFGQQIKFLRTKRKIKQLELAQGICSVSYLSKVENDTIVPSDEIKNHLLERLGVHPDIDGTERKISNDLENWNQTIIRNEVQKADEMYEHIQSYISPFLKKEYLIKLNLYSIHYFVLKKDFDKAAEEINEAKENALSFSMEEKYYFQRYLGKFYYYQYQFKDALHHLLECEKVLPQNLVNVNDKAELYYSISMSASNMDHFHLSISYSQKALESFQVSYNLKRCVDIHILLGIANSRVANIPEALSNFKTAEYLSKSNGITNTYYSIMNNLGQLYAIIGDSDKAFEYYIECYQNLDNYPNEYRAETIICIVELYFKLNQLDDVREWIQTGLGFVEQKLEDPTEYTAIFNLFMHLCNNDIELIEEKMKSQLVDYFKKKQRLFMLSHILKIIADYELNKLNYKNAAYYYDLSREFLMLSHPENLSKDNKIMYVK